MSSISNAYQYSVLQRAALALGSVLVQWAQASARRSASADRDPQLLRQIAEQRQAAQRRRDEAAAGLYLMPRQF
ncbi:hypothetical protein [Nesterenkonia sp.]|uniref:hypothetical protein n=1 Tax=Nesterenkonia sp. TaxID=704201 RepID=UPI0026336794|nr:hypothetical protein [Nesterenkonia sp.]